MKLNGRVKWESESDYVRHDLFSSEIDGFLLVDGGSAGWAHRERGLEALNESGWTVFWRVTESIMVGVPAGSGSYYDFPALTRPCDVIL